MIELLARLECELLFAHYDFSLAVGKLRLLRKFIELAVHDC